MSVSKNQLLMLDLLFIYFCFVLLRICATKFSLFLVKTWFPLLRLLLLKMCRQIIVISPFSLENIDLKLFLSPHDLRL